MLYTKATPSSDPEASFPLDLSNAGADDDAGPSIDVESPGNAAQSVSGTLPSARLTDGAAAQVLAVNLVQVQCWGSGIQGDSALACFTGFIQAVSCCYTHGVQQQLPCPE